MPNDPGPVTEAGRALLDKVNRAQYHRHTHETVVLLDGGFTEAVAAIEAEAVAAWLRSQEAEEALARALHASFIGCMQPVALSRNLCRPEDPRYQDLHPATARAVLAHLLAKSDG